MSFTKSHKLVLLGDSGVGKTSVTFRFANDEFFQYQFPTIGVHNLEKIVQIEDEEIKFIIYDTAGQERFWSITPMYYRDAVAALVVYDITNEDLFEFRDFAEFGKFPKGEIFFIMKQNKGRYFHAGFYYHHNKQTNDTIYFTCSDPKCRGTMRWKNGVPYGGQNHSKECQELSKNRSGPGPFWETVENLAETKTQPSKIFKIAKETSEEWAKNNNNVVQIPNQKLCFYRIREIRKNNSTEDAIQLIQKDPYSRTLNKSTFLRCSINIQCEKEEKIMIWFSDELAKILYQNQQVFVDGTFLSAAKPFQQIVIFMTVDAETNSFVPVVYCALTNKIHTLYTAAFRIIQSLFQQRWKPQCFMCDFEKSLQSSIKAVFQPQILKGCYFHFKQALVKRLEKMKKFQLKDKDTSSALLERIDDLCLVPHDQIPTKIAELQQEFPNYEDFFDYFERTWIKLFPPFLWSNFDDPEFVKRTNCSLERYNRRLNDECHHTKPDLFQMVELLRKEDEHFRTEINNKRKENLTAEKPKNNNKKKSKKQRKRKIEIPFSSNDSLDINQGKVQISHFSSQIKKEENQRMNQTKIENSQLILTNSQETNQKESPHLGILTQEEKQFFHLEIDNQNNDNTNNNNNNNQNENIQKKDLEKTNSEKVKSDPENNQICSFLNFPIKPKIELSPKENGLEKGIVLNSTEKEEEKKIFNQENNLKQNMKGKLEYNKKEDLIQTSFIVGKNDPWEEIVKGEIWSKHMKEIRTEMKKRKIHNTSTLRKGPLIKKFQEYFSQNSQIK
ncbi:drab5 [Anaeramoeba ignava]|uniref:Drab5 n=1 Tax=Anaeramoeba ignava TaxID=1746090 RepID=A0A9Q0L652_ANAIG|nr:drab5 [Anaeramoeba ignava]